MQQMRFFWLCKTHSWIPSAAASMGHVSTATLPLSIKDFQNIAPTAQGLVCPFTSPPFPTSHRCEGKTLLFAGPQAWGQGRERPTPLQLRGARNTSHLSPCKAGGGCSRAAPSPHCWAILAASVLMSVIRSWLMRKTKRRLAICR